MCVYFAFQCAKFHEGRFKSYFILFKTLPNNTFIKVFSGASGILVNGTLISRCGTGVVGLLANNFRVPFIGTNKLNQPNLNYFK